MTWWMYAVGAAIVWGLHYPMLGRAFTVISPITAYWMPTIILTVTLPFYYKILVADFTALADAPLDVKLSAGLISITSLTASLFLYKAIQMHNPVHASLIEITYPIGILLFSYFIFNQNHINWSTVTGGILILAGASIIIYNNG